MLRFPRFMSQARAQRKPNARLGLEGLEVRTVPAVTVSISGTEMLLLGDGAEDYIRVDRLNGSFEVVYSTASGTASHSEPEAGITNISIVSMGGGDKIEIQRTAPGKPVKVELGDDTDADADGLSALEGIVTVEGGGELGDRLILDDVVNPAQQNYTVRSTQVVRQGAVSVPIHYFNLGVLEMNGTAFRDR
jgi:hypothetical protein